MPTLNPEVLQTLILSQDAFVWEAPAFERHLRGPRWYLVIMLLTMGLVTYAVWTKNFLFAFIVLLAVILLLLAGSKTPETVLAQIGEQGVVWGGKLYLYDEIDSFAIIYQPPITKTLYLEIKSNVSPRLRIPLEAQDPLELRDFLKKFAREDLDLQNEHISDILARLLKF